MLLSKPCLYLRWFRLSWEDRYGGDSSGLRVREHVSVGNFESATPPSALIRSALACVGDSVG